MNINFELTVEQQLSLKKIEAECQRSSKEQLTERLVEAMRLLMIRQNIIDQFVEEAVEEPDEH